MFRFLYRIPVILSWFICDPQVALLDDESGDEDDFSALSRDRAGSNNGNPPTASKPPASGADFFSDEFDFQSKAGHGGSASYFDADFGEPEASSGENGRAEKNTVDVDLLNINNNINGSVQPDVVADQIDSLDLGAPRRGDRNEALSNVDLLVGGVSIEPVPARASGLGKQPDLMGSLGEETFDPFQQFSSPDASVSTASNQNTFSPFQNTQVVFSKNIQSEVIPPLVSHHTVAERIFSIVTLSYISFTFIQPILPLAQQ